MAGTPIDPSFQFTSTITLDAPLMYEGHNARAKGFYIAVAGDLAINDEAGNEVIFPDVLQGVVYPFSSDVVTSNTTATVIALF